MDTFSFLVGGCLAAWRAVSWPRLPKVALLGSKNAVFGPKPFFCGHPCKGFNRKMLSFWCPVMVVTKKIGRVRKKMDLGPKNCIFDQKFCIFLRYTYETTLFLARTVPTQWDDNSSISWGNSGYLRFSGRCPFGRSAGRFVAPIAQSGPFRAQKCCFFGPKTVFLWSSSK